MKLSRETAGRKGKGVTVVSELPLTGDALKELATKLKNSCGTGGTAKDGRIEIQGDHREQLQQELALRLVAAACHTSAASYPAAARPLWPSKGTYPLLRW